MTGQLFCLLLFREISDGGLQQADRVSSIVNALTAVVVHELPVVGRFQLGSGPGGIDGESRLRLANRWEHRRQLIEEVLHLSLNALDDAVIVVVHQLEVKGLDIRAMAGLAGGNEVVFRSVGIDVAWLEGVATHMRERRICCGNGLHVAVRAAILHHIAMRGTRDELAIGEAIGAGQHV